MKTYIKFLTYSFLNSFLNIFLIMFSLVFVLNILKEIEFFNDANGSIIYPVYLSLLNTPSIIFEMFPFIYLISTQFFFIKLFNENEINIFKYSGLKNTQIIKIISILSLVLSLVIVILFYNLSSNLQKYYLEIKNQFSKDKLYLAVINKNGLWIKDIVNGEKIIINSSKIENNFLTDTFITRFDENFNLVESIQSNKIDIKKKNWLIYDATVFKNNSSEKVDILKFVSNFDQKKIESMFSNLSSLSIIELFDLRQNYKQLNYSIVEVDIQINKLLTYSLYLVLMTILSSLIMFNTKNFNSSTIKIVIGLFCSVTIYYINNFFYVMGTTEKISVQFSIWIPLIFLIITNSIILHKVNEK